MSLRPNTRTEVRKKAYKTGVDAEEARRRREDNLVEIRKNKREDNLLKKRREGLLLQSQQQPIDASQNAAAVDKKVLVLDKPPFSSLRILGFGFCLPSDLCLAVIKCDIF